MSSEGMRIAFAFMQNALPDAGNALYGQSRAVVSLASELKRRGHSISFVGFGQQPSAAFDQFVCEVAPDFEGQVAIIRQLNLDVVVGVSTAYVFNFVTAPHNVAYHHNPTPINGFEMCGRELYEYAQAIVVVSEDARRRQINYGAPAHKTAVVHNGFDSRVFFSDASPRTPNRIVIAGAVIDYKGIDVAIQAFAEVKSVFPDAELHVFGGNCKWQRHTEWLSEHGFLNLEQKIDWLLVSSKIPGVVYRGELTEVELANEFRQASVLICASHVPETFGLVSIEAQACGCIPILANHGGFPETIQPNQTGFLTKPGCSEDLAVSIIAFLKSDSASSESEMRRRASEWVHKQFSWQKAADSFLQVIADSPAYSWRNTLVGIRHKITSRLVRGIRRVRTGLGNRFRCFVPR